MPIRVVAEETIHIGRAAVIEGAAPPGRFAAVFEDDGATGYFYAIDSTQGDPVRDAVHIYNVANVTDREKPSVVKIGWSADSTKAVLLINDHPHAIFDFQAQQGWCRTDFPPAPSNAQWSTQGHTWSDAALGLFV